MKSDTELAIIAFRNRAAENCKAEVTLEDAVKGDKPSNGLVQKAVMLWHCVISTMWRTEGARRVGDGRFERLHEKPTQEFAAFGEKVLARPISSEPLNRMNPRYKFGVWLGLRKCFVGTAEGVFRAREVRRIEQQDWWYKRSHQQCDRSPVENH